MPVNCTIHDIHTVEKRPTSPARLQGRIADVLFNSSVCRCKVEGVNPITGQYRIVLQGTLHVVNEGGSPNFNG